MLYLKPSKNGFLKTIKLLERCKLTKVIKVGRKYHFSLLEPRWPSEAYDHLMTNGGLNLGGRSILRSWRSQAPVAMAASTATNATTSASGISCRCLAGEPLVRFDNTLDLLETADKQRSDFHLYTSGLGATRKRVTALVEAGLAAVGVGLDHFEPSRHDTIRGRKGAFDDAIRAIRLFGDVGILTYVNVCITKDLVRSDGLWRFYELLHGLGIGAIQLLEPKPCGGYAARQIDTLYGTQERRATMAFFEATHRWRKVRGYPAVYFPAYMEAPENLGCMMGGLSHLHIDSRGNVEPCVFLPVSFGNINNASFSDIYRRMRRAVPRPLHRRCPALELGERVGFSPETGNELPVPFESVRAEWRRLYA